VSAVKNVTVIPATRNIHTGVPKAVTKKRRVAGYARVSTDKDEQFTSYEAQVDYYTRRILSNPDWEFVQIYTDEGITGTNTKHRDGFNSMIADALAGKIDLIVTKSVSRFARNTVDSLTTVRKLKEHGVEVFFEKENFYTFDGKGELLLTIMSSLAQEESRSISENVIWGKRKQFADGRISMAYKNFLGYEKGDKNGDQLVINEEQAVIVRRIYSLFMQGKTAWAIGRLLTSEGIPTPSGKKVWSTSTIESILTNEKYKGDAVLQKKFTVDFLSKTMKVNEGEVPQYYVENSHPAIIPPEEWDVVQREFARRRALGRRYSGNALFAAKVICGDCGGFYGAKVWNSTSKYRKIIWQCNAKYKDETHCTTPHLSEETIKERFLVAVNKLLGKKDEILANCEFIQNRFSDCTDIEAELEQIEHEVELVVQLAQQCIEKNSRKVQNQEEYLQDYNRYVARHKELTNRADELRKQRQERLFRADGFNWFIKTMRRLGDAVTEFDDKHWQILLETATVHADGTITFKFHNGVEITT